MFFCFRCTEGGNGDVCGSWRRVDGVFLWCRCTEGGVKVVYGVLLVRRDGASGGDE